MNEVLAGQGALASPEGRAIRDVIDAFVAAFCRGDVEAIEPLFTPDAVVYPSNDRDRTGWLDIAAYWATPFQSLSIALRVEVKDVMISGDLAVAAMVTYATVKPRAGGEAQHRQYRDMVVLRRGPTGWRIHRNLSQAYPVSAGG